MKIDDRVWCPSIQTYGIVVSDGVYRVRYHQQDFSASVMCLYHLIKMSDDGNNVWVETEDIYTIKMAGKRFRVLT